MPRRESPPTDEGRYVLHDLRTFDWKGWNAADEEERERVLENGVEFLEGCAASEDGDFALYSVAGHKADLMLLYLRPSFEGIEAAKRAFERSNLADYTDRATSYVSVTEVSGYTSKAFFEDEEMEDAGLERYMRTRLYPDVPDAPFVCFYPMSKRRTPQYNWYDLSFPERRRHMEAHGEIGRRYAGKVTQIISGSIGFDDWEWGVTLFAKDPTDVKRLLYEMRFDPSTSKFAEFGPFYTGLRMRPENLRSFVAGEPFETDVDGGLSDEPTKDNADREDIVVDLDGLDLGLDPTDLEGASSVVVRIDASPEIVEERIDDLRGNFEHYDSHVTTIVESAPEGDGTIVASIWRNRRAADIAAGYLEDLEHVSGILTRDLDGEPATAGPASEDRSISETLADLDIYAGRPHGEDVYAIVAYSTADEAAVVDTIKGLREGFDRYDTHVRTNVYRASAKERVAVVSLWETAEAAETAGEYITDVPGIVSRAGEGGEFGTMGMFYTVKPEHRDDFVERFEAVGELLGDLEGHVQTDLMVNLEDENDMFISSRWRSKDDALAFFRDDAFRETVEWGRDILADRPRHVFLT